MAWRCEQWIPKPMKGREPYWLVIDEERGTVGKRMMSRRRYEQAMLRSRPMLRTCRYRITEFDAPKDRPGIPLDIDIPLPL